MLQTALTLLSLFCCGVAENWSDEQPVYMFCICRVLEWDTLLTLTHILHMPRQLKTAKSTGQHS